MRSTSWPHLAVGIWWCCALYKQGAHWEACSKTSRYVSAEVSKVVQSAGWSTKGLFCHDFTTPYHCLQTTGICMDDSCSWREAETWTSWKQSNNQLTLQPKSWPLCPFHSWEGICTSNQSFKQARMPTCSALSHQLDKISERSLLFFLIYAGFHF